MTSFRYSLISAALTSRPPAAPAAVGEQLVAAAVAVLERLSVGTTTGSAISWWWSLGPLRLVVKARDAAGDGHVLAAQRREPVGLVLLRVALAADPKEAEVEQSDGAGEHPLAHQSAAGEVGCGALAHLRQRAARTAPSRRTSRGRGPRAIAGGRGTACARPASIPVAWMWPFGCGQIHTSFHAGGMASSRIRSTTSRSTIVVPSASS